MCCRQRSQSWGCNRSRNGMMNRAMTLNLSEAQTYALIPATFQEQETCGCENSCGCSCGCANSCGCSCGCANTCNTCAARASTCGCDW